MSFLSVINSRHRALEYLLEFNNVNQDHLFINPNDLNVDPSATGVGWFLEIEISTNVATGASFSILGRNIGGTSRTFLIVLNDDLLWRFRNDVQNLSVVNFRNIYSGQDRLKLRLEYEATDGVIYINNVEVARSPHGNLFPTGDVSNPFYIGRATSSDSTSPYYFYNYNINGDKWNLNEGSGFDVFSDGSNILATGVTSNAGGLTYWNNNVWQKV